MKRSIFAVVLVIAALAAAASAKSPAKVQGGGGRPNIFAPPTTASGPLVDVVNAIVTAFNQGDTTYFPQPVCESRQTKEK